MLAIQTVHNVIIWYLYWLSSIKYGGTSDQALAIVMGEASMFSKSVLILYAITDLLTILRLIIADGIMVS